MFCNQVAKFVHLAKSLYLCIKIKESEKNYIYIIIYMAHSHPCLLPNGN